MDQLLSVLFGTENFPPFEDHGDPSHSRRIFVSGRPPGDGYFGGPGSGGGGGGGYPDGPPRKPNLRDEILSGPPSSSPSPSTNTPTDDAEFHSELESILAMQESIFRSFFGGTLLSIPMEASSSSSFSSSSSSSSSGSRRSFRMHPDGSTESTEVIQHPDGSKETTITHCDVQKLCDTMRTLEHADGRIEVVEGPPATSDGRSSRESILRHPPSDTPNTTSKKGWFGGLWK